MISRRWLESFHRRYCVLGAIVGWERRYKSAYLKFGPSTLSRGSAFENFRPKSSSLLKGVSSAEDYLKEARIEEVYQDLLKCKVDQKYPQVETLHILAQYFSIGGHSDGLEAVKSICRIAASNEFRRFDGFSHYSAQLAWTNGNIRRAMDEFIKSTENNRNLTIPISFMIKNLIINTMPNVGRASVKAIQELSIEYSKISQDYSVLFIFWYSLFSSVWAEDQNNSINLLSNHKELRDYLEQAIPRVSKKFLLNDDISSYQRLIESLLHCNMEKSTAQLLRALFDHYYKMGYTKGCFAVMKCCDEIEVCLTADQIYRYNLLIGASKGKTNAIITAIEKPELKYKF